MGMSNIDLHVSSEKLRIILIEKLVANTVQYTQIKPIVIAYVSVLISYSEQEMESNKKGVYHAILTIRWFNTSSNLSKC
jgi:hypothetical protein